VGEREQPGERREPVVEGLYGHRMAISGVWVMGPQFLRERLVVLVPNGIRTWATLRKIPVALHIRHGSSVV
jgi:hypothetical protein